jgi:hypothetical protein
MLRVPLAVAASDSRFSIQVSRNAIRPPSECSPSGCQSGRSRRGQESVLRMKPKYGIGARPRQPKARFSAVTGVFHHRARSGRGLRARVSRRAVGSSDARVPGAEVVVIARAWSRQRDPHMLITPALRPSVLTQNPKTTQREAYRLRLAADRRGKHEGQRGLSADGHRCKRFTAGDADTRDYGCWRCESPGNCAKKAASCRGIVADLTLDKHILQERLSKKA